MDQEVELPQLPAGEILSVTISDSDKLMSFYINSSTSPSDLYLYDFDIRNHQRLTNTLSPEINDQDLVAGEVIRYESFGGLEIPPFSIARRRLLQTT